MVEIYEEAARRFFGFRYPKLGAKINPYGEYGLDAKVYQDGKLISVEEWKLNTHNHHRLEDIGKGVLLEQKKHIELLKKSRAESKNRKTPVIGLYRRFFADAEVAIITSFHSAKDLQQYYTEEWCEPNQWTEEKYLQKGYYIPLYAKDSAGENMWIIRPYNDIEKRVHAMLLEERNNVLNQLKNAK